MTAPASWNDRVKSRWGWAVLAVVVIVALAIGSLRSTGPLTDDDRADSIAQNLACPVCAGESVYESQSPAAQNIRVQIKALIQQGNSSDDDIINYLEERFETKTQLVPKGAGLESLVWILPVVGLVAAVVGLTIAFRRWKLAADTVPTDDDRALVAEAMRSQSDDGDGDG